MSECSEPKQVCRRNALAFLGYAAVFGLVASPAILGVSQAEAQTATPPTTPTTPPADAPKSGTERRQERRTGRTERRQERRTGRTERREERRTGRDERRDARDGTTTCPRHHRAKKVIGSFLANNGDGPASARAAGRPYSTPPAPGYRTSGQAGPAHRRTRGAIFRAIGRGPDRIKCRRAQRQRSSKRQGVKLGPNRARRLSSGSPGHAANP